MCSITTSASSVERRVLLPTAAHFRSAPSPVTLLGMQRAASPSAPPRRAVALALCLGILTTLGACTRTTDMRAHVKLDASTTTLRIPVNRIPRHGSTTTVTPNKTDPDTTTTTQPQSASPATPATDDRGAGGIPGLAALLSSVQRANEKGAVTTTTRPVTAPTAPPTTAAPSTTTTVLPNSPDTVIVTATNAKAHPGETQYIDVFIDSARIALPGCSGRDYQLTGSGWVGAGFVTAIDCPDENLGPRVRRTLPANVAAGQYAFCTEIALGTTTTVCAPYLVVPYPT